MRTFRRFNRQRAISKSLRMSAMGKRSQEVQRARRMAEMSPEVLLEMQTNPAPIISASPSDSREGVIGSDALVLPLRAGEVRLKSIDGHTDVRNDGDQCFGHPGIDWCESCGAVYGSPEWKKQCSLRCPHCKHAGPAIWQNGQWSCPECFHEIPSK